MKITCYLLIVQTNGFNRPAKFLITTSKELKTYHLARGYNNNFLEKQFLRAANISRTNALQTKPKASNDVVPFVVTYNPACLLYTSDAADE